ncbi:MAG: FHA domain-containing protein [Anaerolineales bacterium]|nr:FHA domain-containing protein [Anaerolineales bacterium]
MSQFQFVMRSGPTPGIIFPLEGDQIHIGRDASNGVAINDAEISRKHSRLSFQGGKYVLEDLGSTNGTFVNGQRLAGPVVLKPGDVVSLGEHIVLMYDAINMDPGATVAVSRKATRIEPPPVQASVPAYIPPIPASSAAPSTPFKKTNMAPIIIGIVVFLFICICISTFVWVDATFRWCVFPFSIIAEILRGSGACP